MRLKPALSRLLLLSILLTHLPPAPARTAAAQDEAAAETGLRFRLSEASAADERPRPSPAAPAEALPEDEVKTLLARLPAVTRGADVVEGFKLRERSLPPPRAGRTIEAAFAAPGAGAPTPAPRTSAPLEVVRAAPEGPVELAPGLSVTFSQPMVAVTSQTEAAANVPARLTPQPAGRWRWLGTQTLLFQPEAEGGRFPMATDYTVTVPAGVRSAHGNALAEGRSFKFSTPPPTIKGSYPAGESRPRDALLFVEFDQRVDAARVLEHLRVEPSAGLRLRAATPDEIASDAQVSELVKRAPQGRWVVARAVTADGATKDALPSEASIRVVVPAGTPSAEGPRTTPADQSFTFKTYGPLRVREIACGFEMRCAPGNDFHLQLNNALDPQSFLPSHVRVTPELPGAIIGASYNSIMIGGPKRPNTTYTVTLERSFRDVYGQTLTGDNQFTFKVNASDPSLFSADQGFVILDPAGRRAYTVYSINYPKLKVSLYKVGPEDWQHFRAYQALRYNRGAAGRAQPNLVPPGRLVSDAVIELKAAPDEFTETSIDLSPALANGFGQVFVRVEPVDDNDAPVQVHAYRPDNRVESWVQATEIGLDAFADRGELVAWANSLRDGRPLAGVQLSVEPQGGTGATDADGLARFAHVPTESIGEPRPALLVARRGDDLAILPRQYAPYYANQDSAHWRHYDGTTSALAWYVFDDRKLYRPGEEVSVKGWVRKVNLTPKGGTELFAAAGESVNYVLEDSQGNEITKGTARLNALAGFDLKLKLPATMNLGHARLEFKLAEDGAEHTHAFQVQEFRRPEFEIKASASEAPHFVGAHATFAMTASYYAGGGLAATEVDWTVTSTPTDYTPPNRGDYTFGKFRPWWEDYGHDGPTKEEQLKGRTDAEGRHTLRVDFDGVNPPRPSHLTAEARVQDVNRQTLAARATMLVHPSEVYVGLRPARTFVRQGETFDVDAIVTDLDGRALPGRDVHLRMVRLDYVFEDGGWRQKELDAQEQTVRSGAEAVGVRLPSKGGGLYRLTARVRDDRERPNETELTLWVAGGSRPPSREVSQEKVELIPDRRNYKGGDVAEVLVQSPFAPAEGVLTLRRSGILRTERFRMEGNSHTLRLPVEEAMTPNVHVQVDLVGAAPRVDAAGRERADLPRRPAYASGEIKLDVPPAERRLSVRATPREVVARPGAETVVVVEVRDAAGRAVAGTDTAVVVVDESVLALTDYKLEDPLSVFYAERGEDTSDYHLRERLKLADPAELERQAKAGASDQHLIESLPVNARAAHELLMLSAGTTESVTVTSGESVDDGQLNLRQNFNALAVFAASLPTDSAGRAEVRVKLPDNLTRYRVMAVSVAGGRLAGTGESAITARLPLMARPSAPRFLNYGDRAELPVVVQNQTGGEMIVSLAVRASNAELTGGAGRRVRVPANDRVEVRFPVSAVRPGTARFEVAAAAGPESDAAEVSLPVYTPATTEAFATYGVIDEGSIAQPVRAPADAVRTFGGLEVQTSSTQLQELTDAVIYLYNYPFECTEQVASRVISVAALKDVLAAFNSKELPSPDEMRRSVAEGVKQLQALQNEDGGFHFWQRGAESNPYVSVHVAHALVRARDKGFDVPAEAIEKSKEYLDDIEERIPVWYSKEAKFAIRAYALFVRALMQDREAYEARELIEEAGGAEKLPLEALGWILPVISGDEDSAEELEAVRRHLNNRVTETAGAAHFADSYADGEYTILHSDRRADGVLLDALIRDQPRSGLIPKLVRGLLGHRKRGRWENTQENVFILLALDRYFNTFEKATPDFVARVWLGRDLAGEQQFRGRSADRQQLSLPMSALAERTARGPADLTISKAGAGRLYYRVGARYAPSSLKLAAADYGFRVERAYEAVDDPADVRREPDGTWRVRAGARVRVRVRMVNPARRYHVALTDPLPAGLEALNPALATTERLPEGSSESGVARGGRGFLDYYWHWRGTWYEHQNLRDERAEAFASLLWEGEHEYSYFARATTPGLFVVPPPRAEEMYSPETFGRGQSDRVRVE